MEKVNILTSVEIEESYQRFLNSEVMQDLRNQFLEMDREEQLIADKSISECEWDILVKGARKNQ